MASLEADLLAVYPVGDRLGRLERVLRMLGIVNDEECLVGFHEMEPWHRGGAESYIAVASARVNVSHGRTEDRAFTAKAVISFPTPVDVHVAEILRRYSALEFLGIRTPVTYGVHAAVIYQEYIPSALTQECLANCENLLREIAQVAAILDRAGARPTDFIRDLRTDNRRIYYVDVGLDLGDLGGGETSICRDQLLRFVAPYQRETVEGFYQAARQALRQAEGL